MSDLQFVAISDDGKMIILQTQSGEWIEVPFDPTLVAPSQPAAQPTPTVTAEELSPREIQARIRSGSSVEELAETTGSTVERIMAFAPPILLERSHVAQKASRTIVRRSNGAAALEDIIEARLESHHVDIEAINWDSFRREDGRWTVIVTYPSKEGLREARWLFDVRNSALVPADDEARWLMGESQHRSDSAVIDTSTMPTTVTQVPYLVGLPSARESHLPEIRDTTIIRRETPLVEPTAEPAPLPPAIEPQPVTESPSVIASLLEDLKSHGELNPQSENSASDSPVATEAIVEETPAVERIIRFDDVADVVEHTQVPAEEPVRSAEYENTAGASELVVETPATDEAEISADAEVVDAEFDEHVEAAIEIEPEPEVTVPVKEVVFEEEAPQYTVEVKKRKTPSWDEILFGSTSSDDKPF